MIRNDCQAGIPAIDPFFFGPASRRLFGVLHLPQDAPPRDCAIVVCQSLGDEYVRSHRACFQLALRLARWGFPVMRFDYTGCGDSAGDEAEASFSQWTMDVREAVGALQDRTTASRLCLVGQRLGATLALLAAARHCPVDAIVLWDPVLDGRDYLAGLVERNDRKMRMLNLGDDTLRSCDEMPSELLGFAYSPDLRRAIGAIDREPLRRVPAPNVLLVESGTRPTANSLAAELTDLGADVAVRCVPDHQVHVSEVERLLVPHHLLQRVVAWVAEVCP